MTKEQKIEAYTMLLNGNTYDAVARRFGVTRQHINAMFPHASFAVRIDKSKCVYPAIFEFMNDAGTSCRAFARKAGITPAALYSTLSGKSSPSKETIDKILAETGLTYEVAFAAEGNLMRKQFDPIPALLVLSGIAAALLAFWALTTFAGWYI